MHKQIFKDVGLAIGSHKERLKRQKLGFNTRNLEEIIPDHKLRRWMGML